MANILIVDDDIISLELICLLVEREGHTVIRAEGGQMALNVIRDTRLDMIISDIMMPEVDGFAVVQMARQLQPDVRTVVVSAIGDRVPTALTDAAFQRLGIDRVLNKPYRPAVIRQVIAELLGPK